MGVGRCSNLGGRHFFKQQKCDFLILLVDTNEEQHCNTAMKFTIINSGKSWGGGVSRPPASYAYVCTVDPQLSEHLWSPIQFKPFGRISEVIIRRRRFDAHHKCYMNIINLVVQIIEGSDK